MKNSFVKVGVVSWIHSGSVLNCHQLTWINEFETFKKKSFCLNYRTLLTNNNVKNVAYNLIYLMASWFYLNSSADDSLLRLYSITQCIIIGSICMNEVHCVHQVVTRRTHWAPRERLTVGSASSIQLNVSPDRHSNQINLDIYYLLL